MSFFARASLVAVLSLNLATAATAADTVRLSSLAAASGYTYQWLASESGVSLQRPGVIIVLHAGYPLYEVNATPVQADRAPRFEAGDLIVSTALAERLRRIAIAHPITTATSEHASLPLAANDAPGAPATGALTIHARQIPGHDALSLRGTAPANAVVTITLTGELSQDLPTVVLSRISVMSADDGSYSVVASIGPDTHRGTTVAATATSLAGTSSAVARVVIDAPNPSINSSLDQFPPK